MKNFVTENKIIFLFTNNFLLTIYFKSFKMQFSGMTHLLYLRIKQEIH
jgi:hypothetical protein